MLKSISQSLVESSRSGDWIITKVSSGLMMLDMNTDISTNTLLMTGATASYSGTLTLPVLFTNGDFVAQATIFANTAAQFLLIDNPTITVRPKTASTLDIAAQRSSTVHVDGYFYSIRCVGFWK